MSACGKDHQLQSHGADVEGAGACSEEPVNIGMGSLVPCGRHGAAPGPNTQPAACRQDSARALPDPFFGLLAPAGGSLGTSSWWKQVPPPPPCAESQAAHHTKPLTPGLRRALNNTPGQHCYMLLSVHVRVCMAPWMVAHIALPQDRLWIKISKLVIAQNPYGMLLRPMDAWPR